MGKLYAGRWVQKGRRGALSPGFPLLQAAIQCERSADSRAIEGGTVSQGIAEHRATDRAEQQERRKTGMTCSSFNRMIVPSTASIWGDLSHGVDCLRIGTATAAAACKEKTVSHSPLSLSLSPFSVWFSLCMSDKIGKSKPCVCACSFNLGELRSTTSALIYIL